MIYIGITSNIKKYYKGHIDFIDHYWLTFFSKKKLKYILIPNNKKLSEMIFTKINFLILTGGNDIKTNNKESQIRNKIEFNLIKIAVKKKIPILGICRGAQLLNLFFGGKIRKLKKHMRVRHNIFLEKKKIFEKTKFSVNSFHNDGISSQDLSIKLEALARDKDKNIELYKHKSKKIIGVMWHPEREKDLKKLNKIINFLSK